jgi:hypothetical protein
VRQRAVDKMKHASRDSRCGSDAGALRE